MDRVLSTSACAACDASTSLVVGRECGGLRLPKRGGIFPEPKKVLAVGEGESDERLRREADAAQQILKTRVPSDGIESRIHFHPRQPVRAFCVGVLQPMKRLLGILQGDMDGGEEER